MARYIDAEPFIEDLLKEMDAILNDDGKVIWSDHVCIGQDAQDIIDLVNEQPTADVVEVVKCKDCIHFVKKEESMFDIDYCKILYYIDGSHREVCKYDFCSYGKKVE